VTAEIGYTTNDQNLKLSGPNQPPTRWTMPAHWHNITQHFEVGGKQLELEVLLFDSCVMVGNTDVYNEDGRRVRDTLALPFSFLLSSC
jgi:hypothetical protein